jgi:glutamine synthetase
MPSKPLNKLNQVLGSAQTELKKLERITATILSLENEEEKASKIAAELKPQMESLREQCDALENMVADDFWPLPKYREMLMLS